MWCKICYFVILYFVIQDVCDILKSIFLGHPELRQWACIVHMQGGGMQVVVQAVGPDIVFGQGK